MQSLDILCTEDKFLVETMDEKSGIQDIGGAAERLKRWELENGSDECSYISANTDNVFEIHKIVMSPNGDFTSPWNDITMNRRDFPPGIVTKQVNHSLFNEWVVGALAGNIKYVFTN
jgi:hypothetical protein